MVDRRVEVGSRHKVLEESAAPLISFFQYPALVQELRSEKQYNLQMLQERYQVHLTVCTSIAHFALTVIGALVPFVEKFDCEILMQNWDVATELNRLKEIVDSKSFSSPLNQLQLRTWLMHWSLFIFFSHYNGRNGITDMFISERYLNALQTKCTPFVALLGYDCNCEQKEEEHAQGYPRR